MPGRGIQELQRVTDWQDDDLLYVVRQVGGQLYDRAVPRSSLGRNIRKAVLNLTSAEVLALNTTPQTIVAAPGAGKCIIPLYGLAQLAGVGTPYATNVAAVVGGGNNVGASNFWSTFGLNAAASTVFVLNTNGAATFQIEENEPLVVTEGTGDPTAGDGTLAITIFYLVEDL